MSQILLDLTTGAGWTVARFTQRVNNVLTRFHDPLVRYRLNGRVLLVPLSHALPLVRRELPLYSDNLRRLASFLRESRGGLRMIDVGANVGDSWAMAGASPGDAFLLVEGSPRFFSILERNTAGERGVVCVRALLSDRVEEVEAALVLDHGNATVRPAGRANLPPGEGASPLHLETLDAVLASHPEFRASGLVKVDAEGYDRRVLAGGRSFLAERRPVILFEHNPGELALAGDDDEAIFRDLGSLGYGRLFFYDHRGHLVGATSDGGDGGSDGPWVTNLMRYARHQGHFYYDVVAFHREDSAGAGAFLARERAFFDSRG